MAHYDDCRPDTAKIARSIPPLEEAKNRVMAMSERISILGSELEGHADRVSGCIPEQAAANTGRTSSEFSGALGELFDALIHLDSQIDRLTFHAGRNTTLA